MKSFTLTPPVVIRIKIVVRIIGQSYFFIRLSDRYKSYQEDQHFSRENITLLNKEYGGTSYETQFKFIRYSNQLPWSNQA